ncbi:hypothetical protein QR680_019227 [Steinernema hermaphroditum]|uniref:HTH OST-type domain-containing protein n=1 Tax=Steinernema hermaphroditum TaxID=289476 RepID=A0AA39HLQ3_9BILA|nr:hypothetical protein QR680_019227 [Steinernema hermaphroditum]
MTRRRWPSFICLLPFSTAKLVKICRTIIFVERCKRLRKKSIDFAPYADIDRPNSNRHNALAAYIAALPWKCSIDGSSLAPQNSICTRQTHLSVCVVSSAASAIMAELSNDEYERLIKDFKDKLRSSLIHAGKDGVPIDRLVREFKPDWNEEFPTHRLGYNRHEDLLLDCDDTVMLVQVQRKWHAVIVPDKSTGHVTALVDATDRKSKKKKSASRGQSSRGGGSSFKNTWYTPRSQSSMGYTQNQYNSTYNPYQSSSSRGHGVYNFDVQNQYNSAYNSYQSSSSRGRGVYNFDNCFRANAQQRQQWSNYGTGEYVSGNRYQSGKNRTSSSQSYYGNRYDGSYHQQQQEEFLPTTGPPPGFENVAELNKESYQPESAMEVAADPASVVSPPPVLAEYKSMHHTQVTEEIMASDDNIVLSKESFIALIKERPSFSIAELKTLFVDRYGIPLTVKLLNKILGCNCRSVLSAIKLMLEGVVQVDGDIISALAKSDAKPFQYIDEYKQNGSTAYCEPVHAYGDVPSSQAVTEILAHCESAFVNGVRSQNSGVEGDLRHGERYHEEISFKCCAPPRVLDIAMDSVSVDLQQSLFPCAEVSIEMDEDGHADDEAFREFLKRI